MFRGGRRLYHPDPLHVAREHARREIARLHPGVKRFVNPHLYPVGLERGLHRRRTDPILPARG